MSRRAKETLVGGLVLAVFALVLGFSYGMRGLAEHTARPGYELTAKFNRVDGLCLGDQVRLGGIPIGTVEDMALADGYRVRVTLRIRDGVPLPTDTSVAVHTDGLFGGKYLELLPGGEMENLKDGDAIVYTQDAQVVAELLDRIIAEGRARLASQREQGQGQETEAAPR